jgi:hypothetical protein
MILHIFIGLDFPTDAAAFPQLDLFQLLQSPFQVASYLRYAFCSKNIFTFATNIECYY